MRPSAFVPHAHLRSPSLFPSKSPQLNQHDLVPRIPALAATILYDSQSGSHPAIVVPLLDAFSTLVTQHLLLLPLTSSSVVSKA